MRNGNGWYAIAGVLFVLLLLWGGSYAYFRQTHRRMIPVYHEPKGYSGVYEGLFSTQPVVVYKKDRWMDVVFYDLHAPLFRLEEQLRGNAAAECALVPTVPGATYVRFSTEP